MSIRKRIEGSREERAKARAKRREEARRAERAKRTAKAEKADQARPKAEKGAQPDRTAEKQPESPRRPKDSQQRRRSLAGDARKVGGGAASVGAEVLKLGREMLVIPVQLWLAGAEILGRLVLRVWLRAIRPVLAAVWRFGRACLRFAERHVTPARAVAAVAIAACAALAASQWLDYRSVTVGVDAYAGEVGAVAPAPEVESEVAGDAHAWVMVPLAVAALVATGLALTGRRRVAALLIPLGVAVIAIALIVDVPSGLDEGTAAVAYEDVSASLLEGFWIQLAAAAVLIACGLLLPRYLRPQSAKEAAASTPTGPTLFDKAARAARGAARRRPSLPKPKVSLPKRSRPKRKVQGAGL
jgi:hypothetical protein